MTTKENTIDPQAADLVAASSLAAARDEQFERWRCGERALVEQLLARHPSLAGNEEAILELICTELLLRDEAGESPMPEEYAARFPALAEAAARQVEAHRLLGALSIGDEDDLTVHGASGPEDAPLDPFRIVAPGIAAMPTAKVMTASVPTASFPTVPGYEIRSELGRGGMGVVYLAVDRDLKRTVALKMIREQADADGPQRERFRTEATAVARLQHPNIVQIHDYGEQEGRPYFSLEYVPGGALDRLMRGGPQPVADSVALVIALARAVAFAHRQGIIHRDLKPANILLARRSDVSGSGFASGSQYAGGSQTANRAIPNPLSPASGERAGVRGSNGPSIADEFIATLADAIPKITDFGLAKSLESELDLTRSEAIVGTPAYMSPEQAWGRSRDVGPATDVHALGLILYELLTGRNPYRDPSFARSLDKVRFDEPAAPSSLRPDIPATLDDVCRRCLRKEPAERYATADDLADDLERVLSGQSVRVEREPVRPRSRVVALVGSVGALALLAAVGFAIWNGAQSTPPDGGSSESRGTDNLAPTATTTVRTVGERFALLSGVRSYRLPGITLDLSYTEADVDELSRTLLKTGFERKNIRLLTQWGEADNPSLAPTGNNIRVQLKSMLARCIPDDTFLVVLTGMGGNRGRTGMYCYLPADADPDRPDTLIPLSELYDLLRDCPARRKLVLVDTCQTVDGGSHDWPPVPDPPPGVAALFACSPGEASYESDTVRHGVFTHHVLRGLEGRADENHDGTLTLKELSDFSRSGVREFLEKEAVGRTQTPLLVTSLPGETPILPLKAGSIP